MKTRIFERYRSLLGYRLREADEHRHRFEVFPSVASSVCFPSLDVCAIVAPAPLDCTRAKGENNVQQTN
jgi:hypothetical protein